MISPKKKRSTPRAEMKWPVVIKANSGQMEGVTQNISKNGAFIRCVKPLRLNEVFDLSIEVPDLDYNLMATAEVVWSNIYGPDDEITPRGMGVVFTKISDEDRKFVSKVVSENLKS